MGKRLIAIYPILYRARQYGVGEELPAQEAGMVEAWIKAETAEWRGTEKRPEAAGPPEAAEKPEQAAEPPTVTVTQATAEAGMEGTNTNGEEGALTGRIPKTPEREKAKPTARTAKGRSSKATPVKKK